MCVCAHIVCVYKSEANLQKPRSWLSPSHLCVLREQTQVIRFRGKKVISLYPLSRLTNPHSADFIGNFPYMFIKSFWSVMLIKFTISLLPIWMLYPLLNVERGSLQKWLHSFAEVFKLFKQNTVSVLFAFPQSNILLLSSLMKCLPCNAKFMQASVSIASFWPLLTVLVQMISLSTG